MRFVVIPLLTLLLVIAGGTAGLIVADVRLDEVRDFVIIIYGLMGILFFLIGILVALGIFFALRAVAASGRDVFEESVKPGIDDVRGMVQTVRGGVEFRRRQRRLPGHPRGRRRARRAARRRRRDRLRAPRALRPPAMRNPFRRRPARPSDGLSYQVVEVIGSSAKSLDEAVGAAAERIAERARAKRGCPSIDIVGLAMLGAAAAGAFAAVRALLERDAEELPVPEPLEQAAAELQGELRHAREALQAGIVEARRATTQAMQGPRGRLPRAHRAHRAHGARRRPRRAGGGRRAVTRGADPRAHHGGRRLGSAPYLGPRTEPYTGSGEVSEWFKVPLSKSGRRKPRGFESHPLRQHRPRSKAHPPRNDA